MEHAAPQSIMGYSPKRMKEVAEIKLAAVQRIRAEIGRIHSLPSHKYIADFTAEFSAFDCVCDPAEILNEAATANLIWIGDYHSLANFQAYASKFVPDLNNK